MIKKILSILCCGIMTCALISCGNTSYDNKNADSSKEPNVTNEEKVEETKKDEPPVSIDKLPMDINIKAPDSIGQVYMDATFTNNTDKNIVGYNVTVLLKDTNETVYLSSYDTVLPGETSPSFESFGPSTQSKDDFQILKYDITIDNGDGTQTYVNYDNKLNKYQWN